jgi:hypothetical protein
VDVSKLSVGDRVVMVRPDTGEWCNRRGWNELPGRVVAVWPERGAFQVTRYNRGSTFNHELVGRDFGIIWPKGHSKAHPYQNSCVTAPASYGRRPSSRSDRPSTRIATVTPKIGGPWRIRCSTCGWRPAWRLRCEPSWPVVW